MRGGVAPFRFERELDLPVPAAVVWERLGDTGSYERWWPWLRLEEPLPLAEGTRVRCWIRPPLPYRLALVIEAMRVVPGRTVEVAVSGDLSGRASLEIADGAAHTSSSQARLTWELDVERPVLRTMARVARPVLAWGHEWVVDTGVTQFRRALSNGSGPDGSRPNGAPGG